MARSRAAVRALKVAAFLLCCAPLAKLVVDGLVPYGLGANPIQEVLDRLGFWTLTFLVASLVPTPAHELLGLSWPVRLRRTVGLFAAGYATLHLTWYVAVDQGLDVHLLLQDVARRKFMTVGFVAWLGLVPLAVTSTDRAVRRLGYARWKRLHRLVYASAALGVVHFVWRVKADATRPYVFGAILAALLAARLPGAIARARSARRRTPALAGAREPGAGL